METTEGRLNEAKKSVNAHLAGKHKQLSILNLFGFKYESGILNEIIRTIESKKIKYYKVDLAHADVDGLDFDSKGFDLILYVDFHRATSDVREAMVEHFIESSETPKIVTGESPVQKSEKLAFKILRQWI